MKTQSVLEKIIYNFVSELCSVIKTFIYLIINKTLRQPDDIKYDLVCGIFAQTAFTTLNCCDELD